MQATKITPPTYAKRLGIDPNKVLQWIRNGELRAVNVATRATGRPRYVIDESDIEAFENRRSTRKVKVVQPRRNRADDDIIKYF